MGTHELCVVMPVYNEQEAIGAVLEKWDAALKILGIDYEIRPYNDGSRDGSLGVMREVAARLGSQVNVRDKPNGGHGNTILTGYREAAADGFDWIFQIDSDDEMGPEKFGELWSRRADFDFLVGTRQGRVQQLPRKVMSFVSRLCVRLFYGKSVWDVNTPYRLMRVSAFRGFYEAIPLTTFAPNVILSGLAARYGLRSFETPVPQHDRMTGEVSIKKWKLLKAAVRSFWQTVSFAVGMNAMGRGRVSATFVRLCVMTLCVAGLAFSMLCVSEFALCVEAASLLAIWLCVRGRLYNGVKLHAVLNVVECHWIGLLSTVVAVGVAYRVVLCCMVPSVGTIQVGDSPWFWECAKSMATASFPEYKSWAAPGLYALAIKLFGTSYLTGIGVNICLHIVTGLLIFAVSRRMFRSASAGIVSASFFLLSPRMADFSLKIYGEHLYWTLLTGTMLCMDVWRIGRSLAMATVIPVLVWLTLWTRSDGGLLLLAMVPSLYCLALVAEGGRRVRTILALFVFVAVSCAGIAIGRTVNVRCHGIDTFLCSYDGWWPRLFGCNVASEGRLTPNMRLPSPDGNWMTNKDKKMIFDLYEQKTGHRLKMIPNHCPSVLVPYIKEEISRRWAALSLSEKMSFVLKKERRVFGNFGLTSKDMRKIVQKGCFSKVAVGLLSTLSVVGAFIYLCRLLMSQFCSTSADSVKALFSMQPVIICLGMVGVIVFAEANVRYGLVVHVLFSVFAGVFVPLVRNAEIAEWNTTVSRPGT